MFRHLRNWLFVLKAVQVLEASSWIPENNSVFRNKIIAQQHYLPGSHRNVPLDYFGDLHGLKLDENDECCRNCWPALI